jgi:hypothetical protein
MLEMRVQDAAAELADVRDDERGAKFCPPDKVLRLGPLITLIRLSKGKGSGELEPTGIAW